MLNLPHVDRDQRIHKLIRWRKSLHSPQPHKNLLLLPKPLLLCPLLNLAGPAARARHLHVSSRTLTPLKNPTTLITPHWMMTRISASSNIPALLQPSPPVTTSRTLNQPISLGIPTSVTGSATRFHLRPQYQTQTHSPTTKPSKMRILLNGYRPLRVRSIPYAKRVLGKKFPSPLPRPRFSLALGSSSGNVRPLVR